MDRYYSSGQTPERRYDEDQAELTTAVSNYIKSRNGGSPSKTCPALREALTICIIMITDKYSATYCQLLIIDYRFSIHLHFGASNLYTFMLIHG